ncbi:hypothetical protein [Desulfovibrio sp. MES5]|nr:hypothetical protein [Desulfovibrio sp. MES5]
MRAYSYREAVESGLEPQDYIFANEEITSEALFVAPQSNIPRATKG